MPGAGGVSIRPEPLVSVIMIFLDAERFIEEAIASVFAQTWPNWELLLIDDGSRDGSTAIAHRHAASHPDRVRYLEHPSHAHRGTGPSRNLGTAASRGRYLAFLDADDIWLPERLSRHVALLERLPAVDLVQSRYLIWYSWDEERKRIDEDHLGPSFPIFDQGIAPPLALRLLLAAPSFSPGLFNVTVRREAALAVGGFEDCFRGLFEDHVFFAKLYLEKTVLVIRDCLVRYRRHRWSYTRRARTAGGAAAGTGNSDERVFLEWLCRYLVDRGVDDPAISQILRTEMRRHAHSPPIGLLRLRSRALSDLRAALQALLPRPAYLALVRRRRQRSERAVNARLVSLLEERRA